MPKHKVVKEPTVTIPLAEYEKLINRLPTQEEMQEALGDKKKVKYEDMTIQECKRCGRAYVFEESNYDGMCQRCSTVTRTESSAAYDAMDSGDN